MSTKKKLQNENNGTIIPNENAKILIAFSNQLLKQANKSQRQEEIFAKIEANGGIVKKDKKTGKYQIIPNNLLNQEQKDKKVAKISALWNIAHQSNLERDKQILTLSALTIGGLLVFLQGGFSTGLSFIFWFIAIVSFLISVILSLETLSNNYNKIESLLSHKESIRHLCNDCKNYIDDTALVTITKIYDNIEKWTYRSFLLGIFFAILFALYQSGISFQLPINK